ncbi:hypothetical protein NP493_7258g00001 [Ridgeia piscesae]|uniref:Integrase catalytic domain-containing protein n=1 Tax=Ridgeia piscesae TaxID=27915 RepID=A0AAD9IQW8_RIDPI|nr:hypothetical protein NP493_7258g00001 [Ridgeia piscesae]
MVTTDYHSGFFELDYLPDTTSETVVGKLKNNFSRHGIPHTLVGDNGPQYASAVFRKFAQDWQFVHETTVEATAKPMVQPKRRDWTLLPSKPPTSQTIRPSEHDTTHDRPARPERMITSGVPRGRTTIRKPSLLRQTQPQLNNRKLQQSHRIHDQVTWLCQKTRRTGPGLHDPGE